MTSPREEPREEEPREEKPRGDEVDQTVVDREWSRILAGLGPLSDASDATGVSGVSLNGGPSRSDAGTGRGSGAGSGPRDYTVTEPEEDFVPPDPPALGSRRPGLTLSVIGAAGAPLILLLAALVWRQMPDILVKGLIVVFVAGVTGLFFTLPRDTDRRFRGDDGAQV